MYIYEAGCMTYYYEKCENYKAERWRSLVDDFAKERNIKAFNPTKNFSSDYNGLICVRQNDRYIKMCDICIVNLDDLKESSGTHYEIFEFERQKKPVIAFGKRSYSPHINSCISHYCDDIQDVFDLLDIMFSQNNYK